MKTSYFFLLTVCAASSANAAPSLDDSVYPSTYEYSSTSSSSIAGSLSKLQKEVSSLKTKVADQAKIIRDLNARQNTLENRVYAGNLDRNPNYNPSESKRVGRTIEDHQSGSALPGERSSYARAYNIFRDGDYDLAIDEFQAIINNYPDGEYADNAQYWIGEALLKKGNKQSAMKAFDKVIRVYPRSPKVPDALLKLGMTQYSIGNKDKAREYYDYLIDTYPGTASANKAIDKKNQTGL